MGERAYTLSEIEAIRREIKYRYYRAQAPHDGATCFIAHPLSDDALEDMVRTAMAGGVDPYNFGEVQDA